MVGVYRKVHGIDIPHVVSGDLSPPHQVLFCHTNSRYSRAMSIIRIHPFAAQSLAPGDLEFYTTKTAQSWTMEVDNGVAYGVNWGDDMTVTDLTGTGADQVITHTYGSAGTRLVSWYFPTKTALKTFNCESNEAYGKTAGNIPSFAAYTGLERMICSWNSFAGTIPSFLNCTSLINFTCAGNYSLVGPLPSFNGLTSLYYINTMQCYGLNGTMPAFDSTNVRDFYMSQCAYSGTLANFTHANSQVLVMDYNSFTAVSCPASWPLGVSAFYIGNCYLNQASVDAIIAGFLPDLGLRPNYVNITLDGPNNSAPSATGYANRANILSEKTTWTITVN